MNSFFLFCAQYLVFIEIVAAAAFFFMQSQERRRSMIITAAVFLPATYISAKIGSLLYFDPRPFVADGIAPLLAHTADNGFPSDHMLLASAVAVIVFVYDKRWGAGLFLFAFAVGAGRVFVGVHHWIDIIGSFAFVVIAMTVVRRFVIAYVENRVYKHGA